MTHYVAIVEEEEGKAVGVWFPDLPGCFSAGDTLDEALTNAREALSLYAEAIAGEPTRMPPPRTLTALKADPEVAPDLAKYMVALVPFEPDAVRPAAE
ncbi:MAG TPA: type II toxin-antitoxin system HicB family antitoxin [Microvirga sp.]|nr:type II toxin-antitoxin system HicB family antitoxin [Microvirga sp.]